jgi:hypothetical protein
MSDEQSSIRNVGTIRGLLGKETALTCQCLKGVCKLLRDVFPPGGEFVVCALASQQRPGRDRRRFRRMGHRLRVPRTRPLITAPHGTARCVNLERRIDDLHRVHNARIICRAQPEAHERECVRTDHQRRWSHRLIRRPVFDRHESTETRHQPDQARPRGRNSRRRRADASIPFPNNTAIVRCWRSRRRPSHADSQLPSCSMPHRPDRRRPAARRFQL